MLVAGRHAAVLSRTLAGRLAEARALLTDPDGRFGPDDALRRRLDAATLRALLEDGGLRVEVLQGDGVLEGWVPGAVRDGGPSAARAVAELEELAARGDPAARRRRAAARPRPPPRGRATPSEGPARHATACRRTGRVTAATRWRRGAAARPAGVDRPKHVTVHVRVSTRRCPPARGRAVSPLAESG